MFVISSQLVKRETQLVHFFFSRQRDFLQLREEEKKRRMRKQVEKKKERRYRNKIMYMQASTKRHTPTNKRTLCNASVSVVFEEAPAIV
jgi:hypothetical protein